MIKDGEWTLVDYDHATGRSVWGYYDGQKQHYRIDYPVEATISSNTATRNAAQGAWKGDYHRIASIPLNVLHDEKVGLLKAHTEGDDKFVSCWLNSSDNRAWRCKEGTV